MAIVNPQVQPTNDPNYTNTFKPAEGFIPDKSKGIALETLGAGVEGAVNLVDTAIKKSIDDDVTKQVDTQRDEFTAGLEKIKGDLNQGVIPPAVQTTAGSNAGKRGILDANASMDPPETPAGLESGLDRIDQLAAAKAAGSPRLNDTQYAASTLSIAKQLRAQYGPGYRDYIDERVSKSSGLPVASSYYQNMLQDINRQLGQMSKTKDDVQALINANPDVPGMNGFNAKYKAGDPSITQPFLYDQVSRYRQLEGKIKLDESQIKLGGAQDEVQKKNATANMTSNVNNMVGSYLSGYISLSGMPAYSDLSKYMTDAMNNKNPDASAPEMAQRVQQIAAFRQKLYETMKSKFAAMEPVVGVEQAEVMYKNALSPVDAMLTLSKDKDIGPVHFAAQQAQNIADQDKFDFLVSKNTGTSARQLVTTRAILGEQYFPDYIRSVAGGKFSNNIAAMFSDESLAAVAPYTDARGQPVQRYMKDAILHGKTVDHVNESVPGEYYDSMIHTVDHLADPKMPNAAKDQMIDWAFNPKNVGRLDELKMDYRDPNTGEMVPGKYRAFNILSAPKITEAVAETAKVHPENYQKYKNTLQDEFYKLYRADIQTLNTALYNKQIPVDQNGNPIRGAVPIAGTEIKTVQGIHFSFNSDNNSFGMVDNNNRPITAPSPGDRDYSMKAGLLDTLERVNGGLSHLAYVHERDPSGPTSTSKYLLKALQTAGFRPGEEITGASREMSKAIIKANAPETTNEDLNKLLKRSE